MIKQFYLTHRCDGFYHSSQSGHGSNGNEEYSIFPKAPRHELHHLMRFSVISKTLVVSRGFYPSAEIQSVYSISPADWTWFTLYVICKPHRWTWNVVKFRRVWRGSNVTEAIKNICWVKCESAVDHNTGSRCFKKSSKNLD